MLVSVSAPDTLSLAIGAMGCASDSMRRLAFCQPSTEPHVCSAFVETLYSHKRPRERWIQQCSTYPLRTHPTTVALHRTMRTAAVSSRAVLVSPWPSKRALKISNGLSGTRRKEVGVAGRQKQRGSERGPGVIHPFVGRLAVRALHANNANHHASKFAQEGPN